MKSLTQLTQAVTAFGCFADLAAAMDGGYIPTLQTAPGKRHVRRNEMVSELADRLESLGWQVWRGTVAK